MPENYAKVIEKLEQVAVNINTLTLEMRHSREQSERTEKRVDDHEERLRRMEFNQAQLLQIKVILGVTGSAVIGIALKLFILG